MNQPKYPEVQKALLPPHSQTPTPSTNSPLEALVMDHSIPFDYNSFMRTGHLTVAMESHADIWDIFPGARYVDPFHRQFFTIDEAIVNSVTRYFDGTAELHAISQPAALMHLDSFEITFQSSDPTCSVYEVSTSSSSQISQYILFEAPERNPNACIAVCRFRIVIPETLFPWNGGRAQFRIRVCALFNTFNSERPGTRTLQRGPGYFHDFSLQLRTSRRGLPFGP
ncbi:unnamed protein product [Rhizoctonia solani]|uniref:Uncharacterized protein n=1 Tax=Rhizoctonia solani TaxID=456999 RepID=A0A8H3GTU3_9AGAM|nr:unnamed protein product [Rhizoctonia solani]